MEHGKLRDEDFITGMASGALALQSEIDLCPLIFSASRRNRHASRPFDFAQGRQCTPQSVKSAML
jgi:hypothetical protein